MTNAPELRTWLREGPFTLAMSSGFFGFYAHAGALTALAGAGFAPCATTGSSAGALVAGLYAAGTSLDAMRARLATLHRADFWDPAPGAGLLRGRRFRALVDATLPVQTLAETMVPFAPSVFDVRARRTVVLREGSLGAAIHASCALPLLFHPVRIGSSLFSDGGIADRPGLAGTRTGDRVLYHHLASRSPWRAKDSAALRVPVRPGLAGVSIEGLARVNPFALERGMAVFAAAERAMHHALAMPLRDGVVRLDAPARG